MKTLSTYASTRASGEGFMAQEIDSTKKSQIRLHENKRPLPSKVNHQKVNRQFKEWEKSLPAIHLEED